MVIFIPVTLVAHPLMGSAIVACVVRDNVWLENPRSWSRAAQGRDWPQYVRIEAMEVLDCFCARKPEVIWEIMRW